MLSRIATRQHALQRIALGSSRPTALRSLPTSTFALAGRRSITSAPKPGDGPLMERRADRELPEVNKISKWTRTLPIFIGLVAVAAVAIFNYQKSSSPVVAGTLYALRTSPKAREALGDEIYFQEQIPWISGEMNQLQGRIDVSFKVKGTKDTGVMRFASNRPTSRGMFETTEWSLETSKGLKIDLLEDEGDPFKGLVAGSAAAAAALEEEEEDQTPVGATRGFRQMPK